MKIARGDKIARNNAYLKNYQMYNAPHVCFIGMYEKFGPAVAIDVGGYLQTLMLAMNAFGVSCCAQATLRNYPNIVRKEFNIDKSIKILVGISFGYEDKSVLANKTRINRADINENVFFKFTLQREIFRPKMNKQDSLIYEGFYEFYTLALIKYILILFNFLLQIRYLVLLRRLQLMKDGCTMVPVIAVDKMDDNSSSH